MRVTYLGGLFSLLFIMSVGINCSYAIDSNASESMGWSGIYDEAIMAYDEAIRLHPEDPDAWYNKGYALQSQGKYDDAIKAYDEAIRLDQYNADYWYKKGFALEALGKYNEAIAVYDKAIELNPENESYRRKKKCFKSFRKVG